MKTPPSPKIPAPAQRLRLTHRLLAATTAVLLAGSLSYAADKTWAPGTTDFNLGTNWTGGLPGTADNANFSGAAGTQPQLTANITVQGLTFVTTASSGYALSNTGGALLTLTNNGTAATSAINAANTSGTNTISAPLVLGAASGNTQTFTQAAGGTLALTGAISEANAGVNLTYAGNGAFTVNGSNSYTGNTTIGSSSNTTVRASGNSAFGTGTVSVGATSELDLQGNVTISNALVLNGSGITNTTGNLRNLSGNNIWSGNVSIAAGLVRIVSDAGNLKISGNLTPTITTEVSLQGNGSGEVSGVVSGAISLSHSSAGTGTWVISGNNTYTGQTKINGGALSVSSINSVSGGSASSNLGAPTTVANGTILLGSASQAGKLIYTGTGETTDRVINLAGAGGNGTIDQSGTGLLKFTSNMTATGTGAKVFTLQGSTAGTGEIAGAIVDGSGTTSLVKAGNGTWTVSGNNTYTGTTSISSGTLSASNVVVSGGASGLGNASSAVVLSDASNRGTLSYTGGNGTFTRGFTINSGGGLGGQINVTNNATVLTISTGDITGGNRLTIGGNGSVVINSNVAGSVFQDTGTVTINGVLSGASSILKYGGQSGAGVLTVTNAANSFGGGVTTGGWNSLSANSTTVLANTGSNSALGSGGTIAINNSAINLSGFTAAQTSNRSWSVGNTNAALNNNGSNTISLTGNITNTVGAVGTLALGGSYTAGVNSISGTISDGTNALGIRIAAGKWELSGANTYTRNTTVTAGTLLINNLTGSGTGAGSVIVNGGILGGNGSISGSVTVNSGGTLAPGNSPGLLTVGSLVLNSGSATTLEINGTGRGTTYDAIDITVGGGLQFGGNFTLTFGGALGNTTLDLFNFTTTSTGDIASFVSTGTYSGTWSKTGDVWSLNSGGTTLSFSELTGDLSVVPEPATWALLALSLSALMILRRRRQS